MFPANAATAIARKMRFMIFIWRLRSSLSEMVPCGSVRRFLWGSERMMMMKLSVVLAIALGIAQPALAQVKTEVPPVVPGAKPVTVQRIKVHGAALEGNLE